MTEKNPKSLEIILNRKGDERRVTGPPQLFDSFGPNAEGTLKIAIARPGSTTFFEVNSDMNNATREAEYRYGKVYINGFSEDIFQFEK